MHSKPIQPMLKKDYLQVSDLAVVYDDKSIIKDFNLTLAHGEIGCLLGFSGCGKTTALRAIAGLESSNKGVITLDDKVLTSNKKQIAPANRNIGMVFQDYALFAHLSVADNIGFGLHKMGKKTKQSRINEMLKLVELNEHADKKPHQLSGGQQQRVALARALAPEPKLLLLDEPFSNLDVTLRESLAMSVRDILKRTQTTAILVTHDQNEAFAIADKVGVMQSGKLVQWAHPSDLYHEPCNTFVADFIGEGAIITGEVINKELHTILGDIYHVHTHDKTNLVDGENRPTFDLPNGTILKVLVRPDDILHDDDSSMTAKVVGRVFRGANYLYELQLSDGQIVYSLIPSHHDHEVGSNIGIKANLEHIVTF